MIGTQFGRLTVVSEQQHSGRRHWICKCECGSIKTIVATSVRKGLTKSCGCLWRESITRHGKVNTPEHSVWRQMRSRCSNPNHPEACNYLLRGIRVCERWNDFQNFLADMGPRPSERHSLDRINNDLGYSPNNCRWATDVQQLNNTRRNHYLCYQGKRITVAQLEREIGLSYGKLRHAIWRSERRNGPLTEERLAKIVKYYERKGATQ